jgi:hypothetical protein
MKLMKVICTPQTMMNKEFRHFGDCDLRDRPALKATWPNAPIRSVAAREAKKSDDEQ